MCVIYAMVKLVDLLNRINMVQLAGRNCISISETGKIKVCDIFTSKEEEFDMKVPGREFGIRYDEKESKMKIHCISDEKSLQLFTLTLANACPPDADNFTILSRVFTQMMQQQQHRECDKAELFQMLGALKRASEADVPFLLWRDLIGAFEEYANGCRGIGKSGERLWKALKHQFTLFLEVCDSIKNSAKKGCTTNTSISRSRSIHILQASPETHQTSYVKGLYGNGIGKVF